jgi:hypothetical protein
MNRALLCILLLLIVCGNNLHAQLSTAQLTDTLAAKMEWYGMKKKTSNLFVHFDKNIYTTSEQVWFTAYLLVAKPGSPTSHTIAVALIRNDDSAVLVDHKFIMENGLGFGNFTMPDTLQPGNYSLIAFTNALWDGKPVASFVQPITIKAAAPSGFMATLKLAEKIVPGSDSAKIAFKASAKDIRTLASATEVFYTLGKQQGRFKTDMFGAAVFSVPLKGIDEGNNRLRLKASFKNESKQLQLVLPVHSDAPTVRFFPEGGSITPGAKNVIGWEATDLNGQPIAISGVLFRGDETLDTIQTNGYGMGRFSIKANNSGRYHVKLFRSGVLTGDYPLPELPSQPLSIAVPNAVCNDTLLFYAQAPSRGKYNAVIHDYIGSYFSFSVDMDPLPSRRFKLPLNNIPKGVHTLTIIDEQGRPVAERLFFAHYDQKTVLAITTDKQQYKARENVQLSILLKNAFADSVSGYVSVACVQDSRIDPHKMTDIESYTFLNRELSNLPFKRNPMAPTEENLQHWEDLLLIKGWRRYTWQDMMTAKVSDTAQSFSEIAFAGNVTSKRKITKAFNLAIASDTGADVVTTDTDGKFVVTRNMLVTDPGKKIIFTVGEKSPENYAVNLEDPYNPVARSFSSSMVYDDVDAFLTERNSEALVLKAGESAQVLAEVTVTASKKDYLSMFIGRPGRNECGDYVCVAGILNCVNHSLGTTPIEGRRYFSQTRTGKMRTYMGCAILKVDATKNYIKLLAGIYTAKEFYKIDYSQLGPAEDALQSTIFWEYAIPLHSGKPAELSFPTSDITGNFRVIIQGITTKGVIHAEHLFEVLKKEK